MSRNKSVPVLVRNFGIGAEKANIQVSADIFRC